MDSKDLEKIIWPTSVDMMGQIVVAMTFFFLLIFIILAYFLKQIELRQRVTTDEQHYQYIYEPIKSYVGSTEIKKQDKLLPNIDEFILQIQDYILSAPPSRVKEIKSLISKRDRLVDELHKLGYAGYAKNNPFVGDYASMPIVTVELLKRQGKWDPVVKNDKLLIKFEDNSLSPDRKTLQSVRQQISDFVSRRNDRKILITTYASDRVVAENLAQRLLLHRTINVRNQLRNNNVSRDLMIIKNKSVNKRYPFGAIELSYE